MALTKFISIEDEKEKSPVNGKTHVNLYE